MTTRVPLDPDPLHVEPVEIVEPIHPTATGRTLGCLAVLLSAAIVILAGWLLATMIAAPRSASASVFAVTDRASTGAPSVVPGDGGPLLAGGPSGSTTLVATEPASLPPPEIGVAGWATHFPACDRCAAAGPDLRDALGPDWRGTWVTVAYRGHEVTVRLTDWCACGDRHGTPTVIDLSTSAFAELAPTGKGVIAVEVRTADVTLPPTDTAP